MPRSMLVSPAARVPHGSRRSKSTTGRAVIPIGTRHTVMSWPSGRLKATVKTASRRPVLPSTTEVWATDRPARLENRAT